MAAKPWRNVSLVLPVDDIEYTVQPISYDDGLTLIATVQSKDGGLPSDAPEDAIYQLVMGPTWDQMRRAGCSYTVMFRAGTAALQYQTALVNGIDQEAAVAIAEKLWEAGLDPEAVAAWAAAISKKQQKDQTPATKTTSTRSTSTGRAARTPRPASTSGTTSRTTTPRSSSKAAAARSSGRR